MILFNLLLIYEDITAFFDEELEVGLIIVKVESIFMIRSLFFINSFFIKFMLIICFCCLMNLKSWSFFILVVILDPLTFRFCN